MGPKTNCNCNWPDPNRPPYRPPQTCHPTWYFLVRYLLATIWQAVQIGSSRDSLTHSTWSEGGRGRGFHKTHIYYLYQLFCAICHVNSRDMAHGPWTSAHLSIHLPQSFCLNSSAKLWENLVYQSAFVTIKRRLKLRGGGVGLPVVSVKVVIMQKPPKRRKNENGGNFCHVDVAIDIGDMGPRSSHLRFTFFFGSPGCWAIISFFFFCFLAQLLLLFVAVYYDGGQRQFLKRFAMKYAESS